MDRIVIELCANTEIILQDVLDLDVIDEVLQEDAAAQWYNEVAAQLEKHGATVKRVSFFHAWRGAQGRKHSGTGWRTFDDLSPHQEDAIDQAVQIVIDGIHADPDYAGVFN